MDCSTGVESGLDRWIQEVLAREYGQQPTIAKKVVMADVQGHMSSILRVHLTWPINSKNLPDTVVAKIPTSTAMEKTFGQGEDGMPQMTVFRKATPRDEDHFLRRIHEVEAATYAVLKDGRLDGLAIPYYYGHLPFSSSTPCILMEDIHSSTVYDVVDGFDDAQLYKIVDQLVALHVFSFTHDQWVDLGIDMKENTPAYEEYLAFLDSLRKQLMRDHPELKPGLQALHDNFMKERTWNVAHLRHYKSADVLRTFVHGDLWAANIIWRADDIAAIVDWTLCHPGSLTEDLLRVLVTCCNVERRLRLTHPLMKYYFNQVKAKMEERLLPMPFTFEELKNDYHRTLPILCAQTMFAIGFWLRTGVIRKGRPDDSIRVSEMIKRLHSFVEETVHTQGWITNSNFQSVL